VARGDGACARQRIDKHLHSQFGSADAQHAAVWVGAGPRATLALLSASRALAGLEERDFVLPEDVKTLAGPVLEHRILLRPEFEMEGVELREVINAVLEDGPGATISGTRRIQREG